MPRKQKRFVYRHRDPALLILRVMEHPLTSERYAARIGDLDFIERCRAASAWGRKRAMETRSNWKPDPSIDLSILLGPDMLNVVMDEKARSTVH